jgi:hypothetical protein
MMVILLVVLNLCWGRGERKTSWSGGSNLNLHLILWYWVPCICMLLEYTSSIVKRSVADWEDSSSSDDR